MHVCLKDLRSVLALKPTKISWKILMLLSYASASKVSICSGFLRKAPNLRYLWVDFHYIHWRKVTKRFVFFLLLTASEMILKQKKSC